jgi:predicted ATPase
VLLAERFQLLKKIASIGHQLLISTHSPAFLRVLKAHPATLYKEVRLVQFSAGGGTSVEGLHHYRDATKLLGQYEDDMHERWKPIIDGWDKN